MKNSILCMFCVIFCLSCQPKHKIAYIETAIVFDNYLGSKERQQQIIKLQERQKNVLDSLKFSITQLEVLKKSDSLNKTIEDQKKRYNFLLEEFSSTNQQQIQQYNEELFKQINSYVNDYGKEHKYEFIYGANGSGVLMYADSTHNITQPIIEYINNRYKGKK